MGRRSRLADAEASIAIARPFSILAGDSVVPQLRAVVQPKGFGNALAPVKTKQARQAMETRRAASQVTAGLTCERDGTVLLLPSALQRGQRSEGGGGLGGCEGARERGDRGNRARLSGLSCASSVRRPIQPHADSRTERKRERRRRQLSRQRGAKAWTSTRRRAERRCSEKNKAGAC